MVLRVGDRDREVEASASARTWKYPGPRLLEQVTREALVDLSEGIDVALRELLAAPGGEADAAPAETPPEAP